MDFDRQMVHPVDARRELMRSKALELRKMGYSYRKIAEGMTAAGMECSHQTAHNLVIEALQEIIRVNAESTAELRALELARLDDLWRRMMPQLPNEKPDASVARTLVRISAQRASLLGLNVVAPTSAGDEVPYVGAVDLEQLSVEELVAFHALLAKASGARGPEALGLAPGLEVMPAEREVFDPTPEPGEGVPTMRPSTDG